MISSTATPFPTAVPAGRFDGIARPYDAATVERLRPSVRIAHTLAELGAARLWELLTAREYVPALGAPRAALVGDRPDRVADPRHAPRAAGVERGGDHA